MPVDDGWRVVQLNVLTQAGLMPEELRDDLLDAASNTNGGLAASSQVRRPTRAEREVTFKDTIDYVKEGTDAAA